MLEEPKNTLNLGENILQYIISNSDFLTEKRLQKLFYIAEIEYIHRFGKRFSDLVFINHKHGMYSFSLKNILDNLEDEEKINTVFKKTKDGFDAQFFKPNKKKIVIELDDNRISILDSILKKFAFFITEEIIKFAKATKPFKQTPYGLPINLDKYAEDCYNNSLMNDKKLISEVIKSEKEFNKGIFKTYDTCEELIRGLESS